MLLPSFTLVLARVAGLVIAVPMLSTRQVPRIVKVWLIVTLSLMAFPAVSHLLPRSLTLGQAAVGMVGEFVVGQIIGFGASLVFMAAQLAGKVVSYQSGMALGQVYNPITDTQNTIIDQIWFFALLLFFMAMRGHAAVISVLLGSFKKIPPMSVVIDPVLADFLIAICQSMFEIALRLCGPAVLALFLTSLLMGFLTKTMPQMNILSVGFSIKILTGFFMVAVTLGLSEGLLDDVLFQGLDYVGVVFEHMAEAVIDGSG